MVGNQWLTHVKEWQEMMDACQGIVGRTMDIILGTMGTTLGNDDGSMANIVGTT
jgi:hypothetical protein